MGKKKDRQRKAGARHQAEQAKRDTQKMAIRIMLGKFSSTKGAV